MRRPARHALVAFASSIVLVSSAAQALLAIGAAPPDFVVHDPDDHASKVSALRGGKPALIVYEDKDAGGQNQHVLERLGKLREKEPGYRKVQVLAIADVASWDFWPAKGFVKDALRSEGKKSGIVVWADWSGQGRKSLSAKPSASNLIVVDAKGKVVWASAGKLTKEQEDALLERIAAQ